MASLIEILLRMRGTRQFVVQAQTASAAVAGVGTAAQTSGTQVANAGRKYGSGTAALNRVGRQAKLVTVGLGVLGVYSYKTAADFQQAMNIFGAVAEGASNHMNQARMTAIKLGADIRLPGISAKDVADSMVLLAKAGFTASESIRSVHGALLLQQASGLSAEESTTTLARTLRAFQLPAKGAMQVVDALAAGELKTTATMREIADGLTYASASAHQMGISMKDTVTSLSMLNDAGVSGTKAGTSFNQMLNRMATPTKKATEALQALRLWTKQGTSAFFDERGEFIGMKKASELLSTALIGTTRQQRLHYLYAIFGREGIRSANIVLSRGVKNWDDYSKAIHKNGQAQNLVNARMKGSKAAIESLRNAWQTFLIVFGIAVAPVLDVVTRALANTFAWLSKYPKTVAIVTAAIFGLAGALWAMTVALKVARALQDLNKAYRIMAAVTRLWAVAQWVLNGALYGFPVVLILVALIALAVGFYFLYTRVGWFRRAIGWAWAEIKRFGRWLWGFVPLLKAHWQLILAILVGPFGLAAWAIHRYFGRIKSWAGAAVAWIKARFNGLVSFFAGLPKRLAKVLAGGLFGKAMRLADRVGGLLGHIPGLAAGGTLTRSGLTLVGERGPEILRLPQASTVVPLQAAGAGGAITSAVIPVQVVLDRRVVGEATARWSADKKARR